MKTALAEKRLRMKNIREFKKAAIAFLEKIEPDAHIVWEMGQGVRENITRDGVYKTKEPDGTWYLNIRVSERS